MREQLKQNMEFQRYSDRSEEHTSELQSQSNLVCRLLLEKKKNTTVMHTSRPASFCLRFTGTRTTPHTSHPPSPCRRPPIRPGSARASIRTISLTVCP